jgi:hypothetical protein
MSVQLKRLPHGVQARNQVLVADLWQKPVFFMVTLTFRKVARFSELINEFLKECRY